MLRKLLKNEFKATWKLILLLHSILLIIALIGRFSLATQLDSPEPNAIAIFFITYASSIILIPFGIMLYLVARFYKNFFTDEGYLMFTLPVTPGQLLLSKTITGTLWSLFDVIIITACLAITFLMPQTKEIGYELKPMIESQLGHSIPDLLLYFLLLSIVGCLTSPLFMYVSIAIGQLFCKHRILTAVIAYFGLTFTMQIIVTIATLTSGLIPYVRIVGNANTVFMNNYLTYSFKAASITALLLGIVSYLITYYIMNKKVNLN